MGFPAALWSPGCQIGYQSAPRCFKCKLTSTVKKCLSSNQLDDITYANLFRVRQWLPRFARMKESVCLSFTSACHGAAVVQVCDLDIPAVVIYLCMLGCSSLSAVCVFCFGVFFFQNLLICPCQLRSPDQIQNKIKFKLITLTNTHTHARIYTHVHSSNSFALMRKVLLMSWYTSHMLEQQQDTLEVLLRGWIKHPLNSTL